MKLWLVRHAQVVLDAGICYGASDVAADEDATQQAAEQLANVLPANLPVYVSGLRRAQQLAVALHTLRPDLLPALVDTRLNELNFGEHELKRWDFIPKSAFDEWLANFAEYRFGGAETTQMLINRVADFVQMLQAQNTEEAVCICHAGSIRALQYVAMHGRATVNSSNLWPQQSVDFGACSTLQIQLQLTM